MAKKSGKRTEQGKLTISYVLPTFNRVEYLGECLQSLIEQDYDKERFEIIVVDNGSTDSTRELVEFYMKENRNISYYFMDKPDVFAARNFGNQKAKAPIIGVCDSDDIYHPDRTRITLNYFGSHPSVDMVNGSYVEINHKGLPIKAYMAVPFDKKAFVAGQQFYFCHDNTAYRKDKILKTPYSQSGQGTDDWNLVNDWIKAGYKIGYTKKELCKVRTINQGIMGSIRAARGEVLPYAQ